MKEEKEVKSNLHVGIEIGNEQWFLTSTRGLQFILSRQISSTNKETGKKTLIEKNIYFYSSLYTALQGIFNLKITYLDVTTIQELLIEIQKIKNELKETFSF